MRTKRTKYVCIFYNHLEHEVFSEVGNEDVYNATIKPLYDWFLYGKSDVYEVTHTWKKNHLDKGRYCKSRII